MKAPNFKLSSTSGNTVELSKVKSNKSYLLLSQEQFLPWGRIEAPTRKEYLTVNKREVSSRKEFLNTDTVQNIPDAKIANILGEERPFNIVSTNTCSLVVRAS